ncbi:MAG: molecular chaperone GrpE [Planctomycetota bacterium]|jgi:molecular chaperone GrpE
MNAKTEQDLPEPDEAELPEAEIVEEPEEKLTPEEVVQRERDEYYENWRRSQADFQNHRRRQIQVIDAAVKSTRRELFAELLTVLDYLDMALLSNVESQEAKNLLMGVQMTRDHMSQLLTQHEIEPIDSSGSFDPNCHEAIEMVEGTEFEPGTIVGTVRRGYMVGKDVLRHAHVKVAAEPASAEDAEPTEEQES